MSALDPGEIRKLTACLTRLGSNHEGEVVAAAGAAGRILGKAGLGFGDLTVSAALPSPRRRQRRERCRPEPRANAHQSGAYTLLNCGFEWSEWSLKFLASIVGWDGRLSEKQANTLASLEAEAQAWLGGRRSA